MLLFFLFFCYLLFFLKNKMSIRLLLSLILSLYQVLVTAKLANWLDIPQNSFFAVDIRLYDLKQFSLVLILMIITVLIINTIHRYEENTYFTVGVLNLKDIFVSLIWWICIFLGCFCHYASIWTFEYFGNIGLEEIFYTLSQPLAGTDDGQINSFLQGPLFQSVFIAMTISVAYCICIIFSFEATKNERIKIKKKKRHYLLPILYCIMSLVLLPAGIVSGVEQFGYHNLKNYFLEKSKIYEEYYVSPSDVALAFPNEERNLIYIFVESLETTYLSTDLGGAQEINLLPNLSQLALSEGINFSNTESLGGSLQQPGTGFTVGGMVSQSSGVPLKVMRDYNENEYGHSSRFMPGLTSLGDILDEAGYNQMLFIGSEAGFAGRDNYYMQHGNYEIRDYLYAQKEGLIPEDYKVWWGYEDEKLFEFAKDSLTELSQSEGPFNFTMLTADTHFPDGYMNQNTPTLFDNQYSNVIHYTDSQLGEFISWIQQQPFYENTTIVLSGDHLSMDTNFFTDLDTDYERTVFNMILNSPIDTKNNKNRLFSTMDIFPTTLAALGVEIEGERLGLGTNLFSNEETLTEKLGFEILQEELTKGSSYYNKKIMQGSDLEIGEPVQQDQVSED